MFLITMNTACTTVQYDDPKKVVEGAHYLGKHRITYYTAHEDKFGARVAAPGVYRAQQGVTVAAHPNFPFGTTIVIPELKQISSTGMFVVQDRGSAVTKCKAAQGKTYVWDVFLSVRNKAMRAFQSAHPMYMDVWEMNFPVALNAEPILGNRHIVKR